MFVKFLKIFLPLSLVITFTAFAVYGSVQQILRQEANNPQLQLSEDLSIKLSDGSDPKKALAGKEIIDMDKSLAPFIIVYDNDGKVAASTAKLDGNVPTPPAGVFDYAKDVAEDRVTWQPRSGVRIAAVINRYGGTKPGYVLAGRNLKEVENATDNILRMTVLGWVAGLSASLVLSLLLAKFKK